MSTYTPIASQTLTAAAASVTFSSIPQGFTDLILVTRMASSNVATTFGSGFTLNNDTLSVGKLSFTTMYGNGTSANSFRWSTSTPSMKTVPSGTGATSLNAGGMSIIHLNNYSNTTTYKTILTRNGEPGDTVFAWVTLWQDTSPINKITFYPNDGTNTILSGSTFSLYGIQVGNAAQKAQGGNIVTSDGTYVYHTFTSSGSFIPSQALTVDYLVVAGGGGGSRGGGGAGGYKTSIGGSPLSLTAQAYTVTIGAGGAGATSESGGTGGDSVFSTITSTGGGGGGNANNGVAGGSGGGGGVGGTSGGAASPAGQGNAGGNGFLVTAIGTAAGGGGGSGGAGANGATGTPPTAGNGGVGTANSITGSSVYYASGGGGGTDVNSSAVITAGTASAGGGGNGGQNTTGIAGTANTGGGGGGTKQPPTAGAGGSGIVVVRYLA